MASYKQTETPNTDVLMGSPEEVVDGYSLIHGYDPDTLIYEYTNIIEDGDVTEKNTTTVPPPEHDAEFEYLIFNTASQSWKIETLSSPLRMIKKSEHLTINKAFNAVLGRMSSSAAQNSGLYELKYKESIKYIENNAPSNLSEYPFLEVGTSVSGMSALDYANLTIEKHNEYNNKLIDIENIRLAAKSAIDAIDYDGTTALAVLKTKIEETAQTAADKLFNL